MTSKKIEGPYSLDTLFNYNLPHLLERIFFSLDYDSYKTCLEVSTTWKKLLISKSFLKRGKIVFHVQILRDELRLLKLTCVLKEEHIPQLKRIISTCMVDVSGSAGGAALSNVAAAGNLNALKLLIDHGAALNNSSAHGYTPLHLAASYGKRDVVKFLLERGADPNISTEWAETPIFMAAKNKYTEIVTLLIDFGAKLSILYAIRKYQTDVIRVLLEIGADPNEEDLKGNTPLLLATIGKRILGSHRVKIVKILLESGACPKKTSKYGSTPLYYAAAGGDAAIIKLLIDAGANPNCANVLGETPLHLAAALGKANVVKILLERGADKSKTNEDGKTPLSIAQDRGHQDVVNILTEQCNIM